MKGTPIQLRVSGHPYAPVAGDVFSIVTAANPIGGAGDFDVGWDTDFTVGLATWQLFSCLGA
jgi:hypothetical protein